MLVEALHTPLRTILVADVPSHLLSRFARLGVQCKLDSFGEIVLREVRVGDGFRTSTSFVYCLSPEPVVSFFYTRVVSLPLIAKEWHDDGRNALTQPSGGRAGSYNINFATDLTNLRDDKLPPLGRRRTASHAVRCLLSARHVMYVAHLSRSGHSPVCLRQNHRSRPNRR